MKSKMQKLKYESNLNPGKPTLKIQMVQACHCLLESSLLTSEAEWRNLNIEVHLEEGLEEELGCVMCCCLEEGACLCDLDID